MFESLLLEGIRRQTHRDVPGALPLYRRALPGARDALGHQTPDGQWIHGPDFLIIGAARSGTTWLKKRLSGISAVRILVGEPNYFSFNCNTDPRAYIASFASDAVKNADIPHDGSPRVYGEKSPSYLLMSHTKISLVKALFPHVKIISMLRDPVERGWSDIRVRDTTSGVIPDLDYILRCGHYGENLTRWGHHVPPSNLHLINYTDVCARPREVLIETLQFLGLNPVVPDLSFLTAPPPPPPMPASVQAMLEAEYAGEAWDAAAMRALTNRSWDAAEATRAAKAGARVARPALAAESIAHNAFG